MTFRSKQFDKPVYVKTRSGDPVVTVEIEVTINGHHHHLIKWQQDAGAMDCLTAAAFGHTVDELAHRVKNTLVLGTQEEPPRPTPDQFETARLHNNSPGDFLYENSLRCRCPSCNAVGQRPDFVAEYVAQWGDAGLMDEEKPAKVRAALERMPLEIPLNGPYTRDQREAMLEGGPTWMPGNEDQRK